MSGLKIFGVPQSRAYRAVWLARELGIAYELVPTKDASGTYTEAFLAANPNAKIPAIEDDGTVLFESMAINLYLARKHAGDSGLWPATPELEGLTFQWCFWAITEVEDASLKALMHTILLPEEHRSPDVVDEARARLQRPFEVIDQALAGRDYLLGSAFTVADLSVAAVLSWARAARIDLSAYPNLEAWLKRCLDRPHAKAARNG